MHTVPEHERLQLIQALNKLPSPQLEEVLFALNPPSSAIPDGQAAPGTRVAALLKWVEGPSGCGLNQVRAVLAEYVPDFALSPSETGICPYKGLEYFDCNDTDPKYFYGREALTAKLLDKVRTDNCMVLVGASGNGKSSVLRAGLIHKLKQGEAIPDSEQWRICITRPDRHPLENLALAFVDADLSDVARAKALDDAMTLLEKGATGLLRLVQASSTPRVIVVVDQFEEAFTRCDNIAEREAFFACLMGALADSSDKLCLILAMRADFVGKCLERNYSGLAEQVQRHLEAVLPMEPEELTAAICKPAEHVGLQVEPTLVREILNDIKDAPGSLPLLQYTLKELWQRRQNDQLVLSAYLDLGRLYGTLDQRATAIYNSFEAAEQRTVRYIFQQLTQLGESTEDTRRRMYLDNLPSEPHHPAEQVNKLITALSDKDNRLLVTNEVDGRASVDVAHEALIRHWRFLRQWVEQNRDLLRQQRAIETTALTWFEQSCRSEYLLHGKRCIEAKQLHELCTEQQLSISSVAANFVSASLKNRKKNKIKASSFAMIIIGLSLTISEYYIREARVSQKYEDLRSSDIQSIRQAINFLAEGCEERRIHAGWLPSYFDERLFGNCRTLKNLILKGVNLENINLSGADITNADFRGANFQKGNFYKAYLMNSDMRGANLKDSNLSYADLSGLNLSGADLTNANLDRARFRGTKLYGANLRYANISNSQDLTIESLEGAFLCNTAFSNNLKALSNRNCENP